MPSVLTWDVFCSSNANSRGESEIPDCRRCNKKHAAAVVFMAGTLAFFLQDFASTFPPLYAPEELMAKVVMRAFLPVDQPYKWSYANKTDFRKYIEANRAGSEADAHYTSENPAGDNNKGTRQNMWKFGKCQGSIMTPLGFTATEQLAFTQHLEAAENMATLSQYFHLMKTFSTIQTDGFRCTAQDEAVAILLHYKRNDSRLDSIAGGTDWMPYKALLTGCVGMPMFKRLRRNAASPAYAYSEGGEHFPSLVGILQ